MATGAYRIWTTNASGQIIDQHGVPIPSQRKTMGERTQATEASGEEAADPCSSNAAPYPNPHVDAAQGIFFGLLPAPPPNEQAELQAELQKVLGVVTRLYVEDTLPKDDPAGKALKKEKFRRYYVQLFRLAQVGLEGSAAEPQFAKAGLASLIATLIDDEGLRIKTRNLVTLSKFASLFSVLFAVFYAVFQLADGVAFDALLVDLGINRKTGASFMLLWIGSFIGVCLSYGVRTATLALNDLTSTGSDRLLPQARLLFIGSLTMVFGLLFANGVVELKVGGKSITAFEGDAQLALLVGIVLGMAEAVLPGAAAKRVNALVEGMK